MPMKCFFMPASIRMLMAAGCPKKEFTCCSKRCSACSSKRSTKGALPFATFSHRMEARGNFRIAILSIRRPGSHVLMGARLSSAGSSPNAAHFFVQPARDGRTSSFSLLLNDDSFPRMGECRRFCHYRPKIGASRFSAVSRVNTDDTARSILSFGIVSCKPRVAVGNFYIPRDLAEFLIKGAVCGSWSWSCLGACRRILRF